MIFSPLFKGSGWERVNVTRSTTSFTGEAYQEELGKSSIRK
jgi:hypothetical protein